MDGCNEHLLALVLRFFFFAHVVVIVAVGHGPTRNNLLALLRPQLNGMYTFAIVIEHKIVLFRGLEPMVGTLKGRLGVIPHDHGPQFSLGHPHCLTIGGAVGVAIGDTLDSDARPE